MALERLRAQAGLREARQEVLITPGEHAGPLCSPTGEAPTAGERLRGIFEGARGAAVPWRSTVAVSSALIPWDGKSKQRVRALAFASPSGSGAKGGWGYHHSPRLTHSD